MKKLLLPSFFVFLCFASAFAQTGTKGSTQPQVPQAGKIQWSVDPFEHAIFVENTGQFDTAFPGIKIYFEAKLGSVGAFFTSKGIIYKHGEIEKLDFDGGKDPDQNGAPKKSYYYLTSTWEGANANVSVDASQEDKLSYYYTYSKGYYDTYYANVYKKITYHNLYPGIDVVYSFAEGSNNMEYTIVAHPGADLSLVKLQYSKSNGMHVDANGNIVISNEIGTLKESAPKAYYMENHAPVSVSSHANNPDESFAATNLDATKTLVIDPTITWTTNPNFTNTSGYDYAYDLDYDNLGNVYCYGGGDQTTYPLQLIKMSPAGAILWVYNATVMNSSTNFYGDFAVDKHSLENYLVEGWNISGGARVQKVGANGSLITTMTQSTSSFNEMWRVASSICPPGFVAFGNGTCCPTQAAMLDTNMVGITPVNIVGPSLTTGYHDMALVAVDPFGGYALTATTQSLLYTTVQNNYMIKSPIPALAPSAWDVPDGFAFHEIGSIFYDPNLVFNAMNGLVCGRQWIYSYNGDTLKQVNRNTGAVNAVKSLSSTLYQWGGIDVDLCDNIYVGVNNDIQVYDGGTFTLSSTLPTLPGVVYDVAVGAYTSQVVYACGQNFVSSISLGPPATVPIVITKVPTTCALCSGSATASAMPCGLLDTLNVTYLWSDGETTRTASHLCSGVDTVAVTIECGLTYKDTLTISSQSGGYTVTRDSTNATCATPGSAGVTLTGGAPPYTYDWSNGSTASSTGPVGAGSYCVGIRDHSGCFDSLCITVTGATLPTVVATSAPDTICAGSSSTLTATVTGGTAPYNYLWSNAATNSTANVTPAATITYSVTVTDVNGCSNSTTVSVVVITAPTVSITAPTDSMCTGNSVTLTASGAGLVTYSWAPTASTNASLSVTPTVTTTYTVIGKDAQGCTGTATYTVYVSDGPAVTVSQNDSICGGKTVTLSASASGGGITYVWSPGGATTQNITVAPASTTIYTVSATNACGTVSANVTVFIMPTPTPNFSVIPSQGCAPLCVSFRDLSTVNSGSITQWAWSFGNGDTQLVHTPIYCYQKSGIYSVGLTVTSNSGCSASLSKVNLITVYSNPNPSFTATPQPTTMLQPTIQFTDQTTDAYGIVFWSWKFGVPGNDTLSYLQNPTYTYWDTGTYCATETVTNLYGCIDSITNCVVIDPIFALYIPSAFTPNADNKNEVFMAKGNDIKTFEMYIFDRWGMQLFHSTNINIGWDGTAKAGGSVCQEDTYVYMIKVTDNKNIEHSYTGSVNLIK